MWATCVSPHLFTINGMLDIYQSKINKDENSNKRSMANMIFKRLIDQFNQTSLESINTSSKMKILSLLKQEPGTEKYLTEVSNMKHRRAMSKLRLSSHSLEIEKGRYNKTDPEERFCPYCQARGRKVVENEAHFLVSCPMSKELRDTFLPPEIIHNNLLEEEEKLVQTLTCTDMTNTAKFIYLAFEHREISLDVLNTIQDIIGNVEKVSLKNPVHIDSPKSFKVKHVSENGLRLLLSRIVSSP